MIGATPTAPLASRRTTMTDDSDLWALRKARARRWAKAGGGLHGYPALSAEQETEATLAAEPPERHEKKPKPQAEYLTLA
jgi:hypothetical protein